jgi:hypothetical protein
MVWIIKHPKKSPSIGCLDVLRYASSQAATLHAARNAGVRPLRAVLLGALVIACSGGGGGNGGGGTSTGAASERCATFRGETICCKQPDEVLTSRTECRNHIAIGCEGPLYCTYYTDDDEVTHACLEASTCEDCGHVGDTGLQYWCHDHLLYGD